MTLLKTRNSQITLLSCFIGFFLIYSLRSNFDSSSPSSYYTSNTPSTNHKLDDNKNNNPINNNNNNLNQNFDSELSDQEIINKYSTIQYDSLSQNKVNGAFVTLARNSDLWGLVDSIRSVQDRFNNKFNYDWVFFNDEDFTDEFIEVTSSIITGKTKYGKIPKNHWSFPDDLDLDKAAKAREELSNQGVIYAESVSYRHMCRFESGFFYQHELLNDYDWYWRVEPDIKFFCDINYDLFKYMESNNKTYGFAISIHEFLATIPSLWDETKKFLSENPQYIAKDNLLDFISDDGGSTYNLCHFWSNFEIVNLNFFRSNAYMSYFEHLDKTNNFYYERWGDAPIHSIAASLFLDKKQIHMFNDIGYTHSVYQNCPIDKDIRLKNRCACNPDNDFTFKGYSCSSKYFDIQGLQKPKNWKKHAD